MSSIGDWFFPKLDKEITKLEVYTRRHKEKNETTELLESWLDENGRNREQSKDFQKQIKKIKF